MKAAMTKKYYGFIVMVFVMAHAVIAVYQVGDTAADFTLFDSDGNPVSLYDYKGTIVLINFWQFG